MLILSIKNSPAVIIMIILTSCFFVILSLSIIMLKTLTNIMVHILVEGNKMHEGIWFKASSSNLEDK